MWMASITSSSCHLVLCQHVRGFVTVTELQNRPDWKMATCSSSKQEQLATTWTASDRNVSGVAGSVESCTRCQSKSSTPKWTSRRAPSTSSEWLSRARRYKCSACSCRPGRTTRTASCSQSCGSSCIENKFFPELFRQSLRPPFLRSKCFFYPPCSHL